MPGQLQQAQASYNATQVATFGLKPVHDSFKIKVKIVYNRQEKRPLKDIKVGKEVAITQSARQSHTL